MSSSPRTVFVSSSRDMADWAALAGAQVREFALRHGLADLRVFDYRDIDPADINHSATWQDNVGAPSRIGAALTFVLFGERIGTPLPGSFTLKTDIHERLTKAGYDWVHVAGVTPLELKPDQVPLTGVLFEFFDAFLPQADGSPPVPLRVIFKGTKDGVEEPNFGKGEFRAQIEAAAETVQRKRQLRKEYEQQLEWLNLFWSKLYGLQQHASLFCYDQNALLPCLDRALKKVFRAGSSKLSSARESIDPRKVELPGPAPYDLDRATFFFGRGPQLFELARLALQHDTQRRLVSVIGESGAGKSSLLRAGLLNDVRSQSRRHLGWRSAHLSLSERPFDQNPLTFLAKALVESHALPELGSPNALGERLEGVDPSQAAQRLLEILVTVNITPSPGLGQPKMLLVVDQLELALDGTRLDAPATAAEWVSFLQLLAALGGAVLDPVEHKALDGAAERVSQKLPFTVVLGLPVDRLGALCSTLRPGEHVFRLPRLVDDTAVREVVVGTFSALGLTIDPEAREALCREAVRLAERTEASILPLLAVTLANLHDQWKERMRLEAKWKENASPGDPFPKSFLWMGLLPPGESRFDVALQHVNDQGEIGEAIGRLGELAWTDAEAREDGFKIAVQRLPLSLPRQRVELGEIQGRDFALAWLLRRLVTVSAKETTSDRLGGLPDAALEPVARPMAESLQHHRLLTRRDDGTWWLVHQAVLDRWPRAAAWRKEEAQIYRTLDAMETDRSRWQEAIASGESDASHWLWTRPREVELLVDWMALRGTDDNPELAAFAKESTIAAVRQNGARAGRVLKVATYFGDLDWSSEILCAAGEFAPAACNELSKNGDTSALTNACHHDDVDLVRLLLRHGAGPNLALASGHTPLTAAASVGSLEVCDLLIAAGAEIDHADNEGWTPLTQAASKGHTAVVARLIAAGADPNRVTNKGWTPMTMAAENGHDAVVARLIADGAEIKHADDEGWTALMWAARNGHDALVGRLIAAGADVNHIKADGWSALMVAAFNGHDAVVTHLIAAGADINRSTHDVTAEALNEQAAHGDASITSAANINRWTALMWAARNGHDAIVGRLIAAGALIDQAADGYDSAVATLVASGVQMDSTAHNDRGTALILAAEHGHGVVLDRLLRAGARANYADHNGMTALIWAVVSGHTDVLGRLLAAGAQVDQTDNDGETALQIVAERGDLNIAVRLLSEGADVNLASHHGSTPLMEAVRGRDEEMVRLLLSRGANPELLNSDGETALDIALKIRAKAIARILSDAGNGRSSETESQCGSERRPQ